jgi:tripartite-type tricarboxylate transporter receptor subunit TctC
VYPSVSAQTVPKLIAHAKNNPGKLTVGSAGVGSSPHMYWELFRNMTAVNMVHVPYRGAGPAMIELLGGQVMIFFGSMTSVGPHIKSGKQWAKVIRASNIKAE